MRRTAIPAAALALAASLAGAGPSAAQDGSGVRVRANVVYGQGRLAAPSTQDVPLLLDLYEPDRRRAGRRPVVVLIHGGAFRVGTRKQPDLVRIAEGHGRRGFVVASMDYRLSPRSPVPSARVLERGEAQLFAVHGDADTTVPVTFDDALVARARAVGVRTEYHRIAGGRHGFPGTGFFSRRVTGGQTPFRRLLGFATRAVR